MKELLKQEFISRNKDLEETLYDEFLTDRYIQRFPLHVIEYCANYKDVQEEFMKLSDTKLNILSIIINNAINNNQDWISVGSCFIRSVNNPCYNLFFEDLENKSLSLEQINNLLYLTNNSFNFFEIKTYDDIKNIYNTKNKKINSKTKDPNYILLSKYGISYDTAYEYFERYGKSLNKLPASKEKDFLMDIKNILEGNGTKTLEFNDYDFIVNVDSNLRNLFVKIYNEKLFKLTNESKMGTYRYGDYELELYDAGTEFTFSIYSLGLATDIDGIENYYEDWNRPYAKSANFCNSLFTEKSMRSSIKHCVYGFDNFELNEIKLIGSNDLGTNGSIAKTPDVTYVKRDTDLIADIDFRVPEDIINNTRYTNNELYRSRRRVVNGKLEKVNPSYIIYFKQQSDMDVEKDKIWQESVKAAVDFSINGKPLPIVIVDCEKCLINNINNIEREIEEFEITYDNSSKIISIVEYIYTIRYGYLNNDVLINKYFSREKLFEYFNRLLIHINKMSEIVPFTALEAINNFIKVMDLEYDKMLESIYWVKKSNDGKIVEKNQNIYSVLYKTKEEILKKIESKNQKKIY